MTRINCVPVEELCREHLIAEYRELPRIFTAAAKAQEKGTLKNLPNSYRLGCGHMKFFYDKLEYLAKRHKELIQEMEKRSYKPTIFNVDEKWRSVISTHFWKDWIPEDKDIEINRQRLKDRTPKSQFFEIQKT